MSDGNGSKAVLITGCSTGIGRETARHLAGLGPYTVYATARKVETLADLEAARCRTLALDVCDEDSMSAAVAAVEEAEGAVWALVNNAGYSQSGAVESIPLESVRRQFETNVFGLLDTVYAVLPHVRASKGRLALISSVSGRVGSPASSPYVASKFAVTGLAASIYYDLRADGVSVTCIEPGFVESKIRMTDNAGRFHEDWNDPVPPWLVVPRDRAARAIVSAIYKRKPEAVITGHGKLAVWSARHFPRTVRFIQRQAVQRMPGNLLAGSTRKKP